MLKISLVLAIFVGVYLIRFYTTRPIFEGGDRVRVTGTIQEEPVISGTSQKIVVGELRAYVPRFPEYGYGEKIVMEGVVEKGKRGWVLKKVEKVERVDQVKKGLLGPRERILELFGKFLPEPESALLKGIILGTKSSLDSEFFEALRKTSTLHVVVASGGNIAIFAGGFLNMLSTLIGRRRAIWPTLAVVWFYVFFVGWQPAIVRAGIMGSIAFLAQAMGKQFDASRALFASAGAMLLWEPQWLFDLGFQLSFAATAGILVFTSGISRFLLRVPNMAKGWLMWVMRGIPRQARDIVRENLATTLAAQIAVSPILFFAFGQISLIGPLVNVLVLWTVSFIMIGGMIVGAMGVIWEPLGQILAWFVWLPLEYFVRIVQLFS